MQIGEALRLMRRINGLSQKDLADELGISPTYVSELERDNRDPSLSVIKRYAEFFEIPVSSLLLFAENVDPDSGTSSKFVSQRLLEMMRLAGKFGGKGED